MGLFAELQRRNVFRVALAYGVIAWVLAQVADLAFDNFGSPEWVSKTVLFLLLLGLPLAIFFAWAFELTPEGLKKEKDVDRSQSITPKTGRKIDYLIIGVLVIAVGFLISDKFQTSEQDTAFEVIETDGSRMSIAVLPFDNRSNREEDEFFTTGIHDDLLTTIAKIGSMKVISRTSVMQYKDTTKNIPQIAQELGVANILEGGVQRSGSQVRINVQLIDAETDEHLWAEIYDRQLTAENLFVIQSEVSNAIAKALQATLSPEEQQRINAIPTQNLEAYEAYMLGRQKWTARTAISIAESAILFQKAVDLDPDFAQAYAGLGDAYIQQVYYGGLPVSEMYPKAEQAILKALELDDQSGEAWTSLGGLHQLAGDYSAAEDALRRAIELDPNYSTAYNWLGLILQTHGKFEAALEIFRKGLEVDPLSPVLHTNFAFNSAALGRFDEAQTGHQRLIEISPDTFFAYSAMAQFHHYTRGKIDESIPWYLQAVDKDPHEPSTPALLGTVFLDLGDARSAGNWIARAADIRADNTDVSYGRMMLALYHDDLAAVEAHAKRAEELRPDFIYYPVLLTELLRADLASNNSGAALERYARLFPALFGPDGPHVHPGNAFVVTGLVHLYRETGKDAKADALLAKLMPVLDSIPVMGIYTGSGPWLGIAHLQSGDKQSALAALRTAVDAGWRYDWWYYFDHHPALEPLRDDPEFQALRAEIAADMDEQLKNVQKKAAPPPT